MKPILFLLLFILWYLSCDRDFPRQKAAVKNDEPAIAQPGADTIKRIDSIEKVTFSPPPVPINTEAATPEKIVDFAKTLVGVPYKYGSVDPAQGFDCSGFITYVFSHFNIKVPRSSVEFTNVGEEIRLPLAKTGDLILFTGTDTSIRIVGHMGIVTENADTLKFIHSTSGRLYGVTITPLNQYYMKRFVKVVRIF